MTDFQFADPSRPTALEMAAVTAKHLRSKFPNAIAVPTDLKGRWIQKSITFNDFFIPELETHLILLTSNLPEIEEFGILDLPDTSIPLADSVSIVIGLPVRVLVYVDDSHPRLETIYRIDILYREP